MFDTEAVQDAAQIEFDVAKAVIFDAFEDNYSDQES